MRSLLRHGLLVCLSVPSLICEAQIPNGGLEDWVSGTGHLKPLQWVTTNNVASAYGLDATCEQGTPGVVGEHFAILTSRSGPGGVLVLGSMSTGDTASNRRGFPYSARPAILSGHWHYRIMPFDMGQVSATLTRWDPNTAARITVGTGMLSVMDSIPGWQPFQFAINYTSTDAPDTAIVTVAASASPIAMVAGSTIWIDDLKFSGSAGVDEQDANAVLQLYPSPTDGPLHVVAAKPMQEVLVQDITGRTILRQPVGGTATLLRLEDLKGGRYLLQMRGVDGSQLVRSFVKQ